MRQRRIEDQTTLAGAFVEDASGGVVDEADGAHLPVVDVVGPVEFAVVVVEGDVPGPDATDEGFGLPTVQSDAMDAVDAVATARPE